MALSSKTGFCTFAFASALVGVVVPVACGGSDTSAFKVAGSSSDATASSGQMTGTGGSSLQFMAGPSNGSGGDSASSTVSTGTGEGGTGTAKYGYDVTYGGAGPTDTVALYDLALDKLGNVIVVGSFSGTIDFDGPGAAPASTSKGGFDAFVAKYDNKGILKWVKTAGDNQPQTANSVAVDKDNRIGFCGSFRGGMTFGGNTLQVQDSQYTDAYAVVLDENGNHVASQRYGVGNGRSDSCAAVGFDPAGNLLATGQYQGEINFGGAVNLIAPSPGGFRMYLAKLAPNAVSKGFTELLAKSYGGPDVTTQGLSVMSSADGDIAIAGWTDGPINFGGATLTPKVGEQHRAVIARLDSTGTPKFNQFFESDEDSQVSALTFHTNGDLIVGGQFKSSINLGGSPLKAVGGGDDIFVARFDKTNKLLHGVTFGDKLGDQLNDIGVDQAGFPVFGGSFQGTWNVNSANPLVGQGIRDALVVKLANDDGHGYWGKGFGDAQLQETRGIGVDTKGNVIFAGHFQGSVDFGGGLRTAPNGSQALFIASFLP